MKFSLALLLPVTGVLAAPAPVPPGIPSESNARTQLNGLTVRAHTNTNTYNRDLFPHWETYEGACNTREFVLQRDGRNVVQNSACAATSGTWVSPYDGATWTQASDVDIDHMVPLKNAWVSGAAGWTTARREQFANDVTRPQLWAGESSLYYLSEYTPEANTRIVTDDVNQSKSDKSPDAWKPPLTSFYCTYAKSWISVKSYWGLSVTSAEKSALTTMLDSC
ncbi:hypothetical protein F66182_9987 [Fusarium sp. NRRL 66182]|nr:hypothetical protein F66182_9987 [Fusarium sp. NRRL 66182]